VWQNRTRRRVLLPFYVVAAAVVFTVMATAGQNAAAIAAVSMFGLAIVAQTASLIAQFCTPREHELQDALNQEEEEGAMLPRGRVIHVPMQHLQLMLREGNFTAEDYNSLLSLDEGGASLQGASAEEITGLPAYRFHKARVPSEAAPIAPAGAVAVAVDAGAEGALRNTTPSSAPSQAQTTCNICLEDFAESEELRLLPCMHQFHASCIDMWLVQKGSCPVCKMSIRHGRSTLLASSE